MMSVMSTRAAQNLKLFLLFKKGSPLLDADTDQRNKWWQHLAEVITPSIVKVVDFAKAVPGFETVRHAFYCIA